MIHPITKITTTMLKYSTTSLRTWGSSSGLPPIRTDRTRRDSDRAERPCSLFDLRRGLAVGKQ